MINVNDMNQPLANGEQSCKLRCDGSLPEGCTEQANGNGCLHGMSLAMVYSPCQEFLGLYTPEDALAHGTLFAELEKPFYGARRLK